MPEKDVFLFAFMGQSNMAGRGVAAQAPLVPAGVGYEYKSITQPDALCPLQEPFGLGQDNPDGVFEPGMKTGSLVSAFANACFAQTHTPLVGVSCAKGGSAIAEWVPGTAYYRDALQRVLRCRAWLAAHGYRVVHSGMLWCQGCTDGDLHTAPAQYRQATEATLNSFLAESGLAHCYLIQIGDHRDDAALYRPIQQAQAELCRDAQHITLVSTLPQTFAARGLMKDCFHYKQQAYDLLGEETGAKIGKLLSGAV